GWANQRKDVAGKIWGHDESALENTLRFAASPDRGAASGTPEPGQESPPTTGDPPHLLAECRTRLGRRGGVGDRRSFWVPDVAAQNREVRLRCHHPRRSGSRAR